MALPVLRLAAQYGPVWPENAALMAAESGRMQDVIYQARISIRALQDTIKSLR